MQEQSRYVVGIDIGTKTVRCVVGHVDADSGVPKIVGVGEAPNSGMRKGVVSHLTGPASAIDEALESAERMSGHQVNSAVISINGSHILSTKADGMIAVGTGNGEVTAEDIARLEDVATTGKIPANREVLEIVPHAYRLDGQDNIKDSVGMEGTRLELKANVVSALVPHISNLEKSSEMANVEASGIIPSVLASARAVLTESQLENGVAVIDIGGATTGVAVFEEGDVQHVAVIPIGAQNVTNDIAIGLKVDPEIAENVKLSHAELASNSASEKIEFKYKKQTFNFDTGEIEEIVEARYEEIFEAISKEIKRAGGIGRLPSGVVLVGGGAKIKGLVGFAKEKLSVAAKIGVPTGYAGVSDEVKGPEYAAAVGLMLRDGESSAQQNRHSQSKSSKGAIKKTSNIIGNLFSKFK